MLADRCALITRKAPSGRCSSRRSRLGGGRLWSLSARAGKSVADLVGRWFDDHDVVADHNEVIPAILRHDLDNIGWKRLEMHIPRNDGADRQREIDIGHGPRV